MLRARIDSKSGCALPVHRFCGERRKTYQHQVRHAYADALHQGLYRRSATASQYDQRRLPADQSASLANSAIDQRGGSITRALHEGGPGRAAK